MRVGTIPHHLWDHWLLGRWLSKNILHYCWDLDYLVQKMEFNYLAKRPIKKARPSKASCSRCRPCSVVRIIWRGSNEGDQVPAVGPIYCSCTFGSPALAGSAVESQSTPILHTLVSVSILASVGVSACFSEKRLKLVTVNRRECDRQLLWCVDIVKYWYANSLSTLFLIVCPLPQLISTVDRFFYESSCIMMVDINNIMGNMDWTNHWYQL